MYEAKVTQVKGSMVVGFVKAIKADKTGMCQSFLTDEAKEFAKGLLLASKWYPFDLYKSCFEAVCRVNAKSSPEIMRQFGRKSGEETMTAIYGTVFAKSNALGAMDAFKQIVKNVYDSITIESEMISDNEIQITISDFDPDFEEWYLVGLGWIERTIELVIDKELTSKIVERSWMGAPATVYRMSWN